MQVSLKEDIKTGNIRKFVTQFISYFCVGGIAAIVEWVMFAIFANVLNINYLLATCAAFVFSTTVNWLLGKIWTFRDSKAFEGKAAQEAFLIFLVSGIGLVFNIALMFCFVTIIGLNSPLQKTASKVAATGIVFIWNFLIRKLAIYRQ